MGNWRTVNIHGKISKCEAKELIETLSEDKGWYTPASCFTMGRSICGLNQWVKNDGSINAVGNLAERDYTNDDIESGLRFLAEKFPSLTLTLHSGSDFESLDCSATFHVENGIVTRCAPEISVLREITPMSILELLYGTS